MRVLGQVHAEPIFGSWEATKAFWFAAMGYQMHAPEVVAFHRSEATTLITEAPARGSKSYSTAHDLIPYGLPSTTPRLDSRHAIVGTDYSTNKEFEYVYDRLVNQRERFRIDGKVYTIERANYNPRSGDLEIVLAFGKNGFNPTVRSYWKGLSSQNEASLQGEQWTTVTLSEAAEHAQHVLTKHFATRSWRTYLPTTPKSKATWLKDLSDAGRLDSTLGVETFHFPPEANPLYDRVNAEKERKLATVRARASIGPHATAEDDPFYAEQFLGKWVYYSGRVLPFDRRRHVIDLDAVRPYIDASAIWLSTDYGYEDPWSTGLWAVLPSGIAVRFDEIYERHLSTPDYVIRLDAMLERHGIERRRVTATGDPSYPQVARLLHDEGIAVVTIDKNAQRDRAAGKRRLADLLVQGPVEKPGEFSTTEDGLPSTDPVYYPGLFFTLNCVHAIEELDHLHYKDNVGKEDASNAFSGPDHAYDDSRYFAMSRPSPKRQQEDRAWWISYARENRKRHEIEIADIAGTAAYA